MNHASPNPAAPSRIQRILSAVYRKGTTVAVLAGVSLLLIFAARAISPRHGLQGRYYANENWADAPVSTSLDPVVSFQKPAITAKTGNADKSSVVWEGIIHAPKSATYRFSVSSDDGSWVYIDGLLVIDNKGIHPASRVEKDVALAKGNHRLLIKYFDAGGEGSIDFNWRAMGSAARFMPRLFLYPRPVGSGLVILDTVLLLLILILKAVFVLSGLMLLALVPRAAGGLSSKLKRLWEKGRARLNAFLATGPKRLIPVGAIWIGLFILILTVEALSPAHGLEGRYFANKTWEGPPVLTVLDSEIRIRSKSELVERTGNSSQSGIVWEGYFFAPKNSIYRFSITSDDGSWIYIDDALRVDNGGSHPARLAREEVFLSRGNHRLLIKYFDAGNAASLYFHWKETRTPSIFLPRLDLYPTPASFGLVLMDTGLFYLRGLLKALFLVVGMLFLITIAKAAKPLGEKLAVFEQAAAVRLERFLALVRKRIFLTAVVFALILAAVAGAKQIASTHGLRGRFFDNPSGSGAPVSTVVDAILHFDTTALAQRAAESDRYSVLWDGYVFAPKDSVYQFTLSSPGSSWVYLDESLLIENDGRHPETTMAREIRLSRGNHRLLLKFVKTSDNGDLDFRWEEMRTSKVVMPRLHVYSRPVSMGFMLLDTALSKISGLLQAALFALGLLLIIVVVRIVVPRWKPSTILTVVLFLLAAGAYETLVFSKRSTSVAGCDSFAYLHGAELMAKNGFLRTEFSDPLAAEIYRSYAQKPAADKSIFLLSPHGYYVADFGKGLVYNVFPPGLSILLYPIVKIAGRPGAFLFLPFLNLILLVLLATWGAKLVNPAFGLCLAAATIFSVFVFENSVWLMSDVPSMALLAISAFLLFRNIGRTNRLRLFIAGACFGFSLVVRYSNIMGALPLAYLLWLGGKSDRRTKEFLKTLSLFSAGAFLVGILPLALYTNRLFGTIFRLVYEPLTQSRMDWASVMTGIPFYFHSMLAAFGVPGVVLILIGLGSALVRPKLRAVGITCLLAYLSFFVFYAVQSIQQDRYLLPAYPFLGVLYGLGVLAIVRGFGRLPGIRFLIVALCAIYPFFRAEGHYNFGNVREEAVVRAVSSKLDAGAVVFCNQLSGVLRLYADVPGYRLTWTDGPTLRETLSILIDRKVPVYFYLDDKTAEDRFNDLTAEKWIASKDLELIGRVRGMPLYRFAPK